jgi:membrane associated rhomboid family serine protease
VSNSPVPPQPGEPIGAQPEVPVCVRHPDRPTRLRCVRCERPACPECLRDASVGYQCVDCIREAQGTVRRPRTFVGAEVGTRPLVMPVLIALNVLMFVLTAVQAQSVANNQKSPLFAEFVLWPTGVAGLGEWWRLLTAGFLHYGMTHIAFNMLALYVLGRDLEPAFGRLRFLALYLVSMFGGNVAVYLFGSPDALTAGASTAVYGLMGAMLVAVLKLKLNPGTALAVIGLNVVLSFTLPGISLLGHLGGLVVGAGLAAGLIYAPRERRDLWQGALVAATVVVLIGLALVGTARF